MTAAYLCIGTTCLCMYRYDYCLLLTINNNNKGIPLKTVRLAVLYVTLKFYIEIFGLLKM